MRPRPASSRDRACEPPRRTPRRRCWTERGPRAGQLRRPSASTSSAGPSAEPPMPMWRMRSTRRTPRPRSRRPAPACAQSGRRRGRRSGRALPRSATCSAARPSVGLTISPANIASRARAKPVASASADEARRAVRRRDGSSTSRNGCRAQLERQRARAGRHRARTARRAAARRTRRSRPRPGPAMARRHSRRARKSHPRLTGGPAPKQARAMAFSYARRPGARGRRPRSAAAGLLRLVVSVASARLGDPQLRSSRRSASPRARCCRRC